MSIEAMKKAASLITAYEDGADLPLLREERIKLVGELREAIAAAEKAAPVAWSPRYSYFGYETQRAWCNGVPRPQDVDYYSGLAGGIDYAYATPPDTAAMLAEKDALLRQALGALELPCDRWNAVQYRIVHDSIKAIRNHLGVKND